MIVKAVDRLKVRSALIDGEAVACDQDGLPVFDWLRYRRQDGAVFLYAFDLLELNGKDLRREPLEVRKATLANMLRSCPPGVCFNEHLAHPGDVVFRHAMRHGARGYPASVRRLSRPSSEATPQQRLKRFTARLAPKRVRETPLASLREGGSEAGLTANNPS